MVNPTLLDPTWYIAAFAGGAFGAAIGALPAFIFTGFMVIAGEALTLAGGNSAPGSDSVLGQLAASPGVSVGASGFTGYVGFGPIFGPHISFAAGAAAAAYAAGLAVGYWDTVDELRDNWQVDRRFPVDEDADIEVNYDRWKDAVERSEDWAQDTGGD